MGRKFTLALAAMMAIGAGSAALASGAEEETAGEGVAYLPGGALTYEVFEAAIAHVDLEACPAEFDPEKVFCRMTLANDAAHVFVFDLNGDQPLLAVKGYALGDGFLPF